MKKEELQERVKRMLEGEKKRREVAIKWLKEVEEILLPVAPDVWGEGDEAICTGTVWCSTKRRDVYFRFQRHYGKDETEYEGFYYSASYPVWGDPVENLKGTDFWYCIRKIVNWVEALPDVFQEKEEIREKLISKLKIEEQEG